MLHYKDPADATYPYAHILYIKTTYLPTRKAPHPFSSLIRMQVHAPALCLPCGIHGVIGMQNIFYLTVIKKYNTCVLKEPARLGDTYLIMHAAICHFHTTG